MQAILLLAIFIIATCGLIYELVAGTIASYLLGDSVTQFSTIIGVYLFSMGIGSYASKFFNKHLLSTFISTEILVGLVGGCSSTLLFLMFPIISSFRILLYFLVFVTGSLVGLEIPILMRILENKVIFKDLVARVFTFDYIGALLASLLFPLLLVPYLGLMKTSLMFGILNIGVGYYLAFKFEKEIINANWLKTFAFIALLFEVILFAFSDRILNYSETSTFNDNIIFSTSSPYQRIVLTRNKREVRLYLNSNLQFSTADEYRYHEALIHPALQALNNPKKVLVLGGGDGLAVREILKYKSVEEITLVDLDKKITQLFMSNEMLIGINKSSLLNKKVKITNDDAFLWMKNNKAKFDFIVIDFPDPSNFSVGKLYSNSFYKLVYNSISDNGNIVIQSTSPYVAPKSFWCINKTIQSVGFNTFPYHNLVPSFGEWGYILASKKKLYQVPKKFVDGLKFIDEKSAQQLFNFPKDMMTKENLAINKLNNQILVEYFEQEWNNYLQ